ncbi:MAG TPA: hypothetical protein VF647_24065 [Longimicrobium sp.]|jgi:hypothetical protein
MPAYAVEFATPEGPRRLRFTLDPERSLGPQVHQILEEMRQHGVLLSGGPRDELGVYWNGADLQLDRTPEALGVTPDRPLELRMRPRPACVPAPEPPITPYFPRSAYAAPLAGAAGALLGWIAASTITDLGAWLTSYRTLDLAAAALLGAGTGVGVRAAGAMRKGARVWLGAASGVAVGALGGGVGAMLGTVLGEVLDPGYLLLRAAMWAMVAAGIGGALGLLEKDGARRALDGASFGTAAGAAGALLFSAPGPTELWQALAFAVVGAALGSGLHTPAHRRAHAVLGTDGHEGGRMTLIHIREWALEDGRGVALPGGAVLSCAAGRCQLVPGDDLVTVAGLPLHGPHDLRNGDTVELGGLRFRFRRLREARP